MKFGRYINKLLAPMGLMISRRSSIQSGCPEPPIDNTETLLTKFNEVERVLLRKQISSKWSTVDFILRALPSQTSSLRACPLCHHQAPSSCYTEVRSHCIFGGGDLLRHVCPECDVIFGPDKMLTLSPSELSEDYEWHYSVYEEGDSTEQELRTFFALEPEKQGTYLNYGAGGWSKSVQHLREKGWNVYAYEPNLSASSSIKTDWHISSHEQLRSMRFNGIYSNNVLEHFRNPVLELQNMSQLLQPRGKMAHTTPCFEYLYEYTRFHLFFFLGKSKNILAQKADLTLIEEINDGEFICLIMRPKTAM